MVSSATSETLLVPIYALWIPWLYGCCKRDFFAVVAWAPHLIYYAEVSCLLWISGVHNLGEAPSHLNSVKVLTEALYCSTHPTYKHC
jgi:hypothetical protein